MFKKLGNPKNSVELFSWFVDRESTFKMSAQRLRFFKANT